MGSGTLTSALYAQLFDPGEVARLWTPSAEVRAMLLVEGALADVQGALGVIPEISAKAIKRAAGEVMIDAEGLAEATGQNGVPVPELVAAFRDAMQAPEHAQFIHWGATSQDIMDTALMLRLRQSLGIVSRELESVLTAWADVAEAHAETPMAARTYGQHATPTSFGAVVAQWGVPLCEALETLKAQDFWVSLSGAAGTASALPQAEDTRAHLGKALGLSDPRRSWHTDRAPVLRVADALMLVLGSLASAGTTLLSLAASDVGEVSFGATGASSTMPQKSNPVAASNLMALHRLAMGLRASLDAGAPHNHQRDGAAWFVEWLALPQLVLTCASAVQAARKMRIIPNSEKMAGTVAGSNGMIFAEALSFALAAEMGRPAAQAEVKRLVAKATGEGVSLAHAARSVHRTLPSDLFDVRAQLGDAPLAARAFARRVREGM